MSRRKRYAQATKTTWSILLIEWPDDNNPNTYRRLVLSRPSAPAQDPMSPAPISSNLLGLRGHGGNVVRILQLVAGSQVHFLGVVLQLSDSQAEAAGFPV